MIAVALYLTLAWAYDTPARFEVTRQCLLEPPVVIATVGAPEYRDDAILPGAVYTYTVTATVDGRTSDPSDALTISATVRGDANGNCMFTQRDVVYTARYLAGDGGTQTPGMDMDGNGVVNAADMTILVTEAR